MNARLEAKDLPCLFDSLVESQLVSVECETKENQRWRRASAGAAARGIMEMAKYYPELSTFLDSLENYSLCERHYNQIIVKKSYIKRATKLDSSFLDSEEKERRKLRLSNDNEVPVFEKTFCDSGVRFNRPSLRLAARRTFAPIWSARRHPIYRSIEIADEEQMLRLKPEICKLIQERIMTSRSKLSNQHQGHDAILEEINKALKSLVPSAPSQQHWEIAARNCTKFVTLRTNLFNIIGYSEGETHRPRTRPSFITESHRFRVRIRKAQFVNPNACDRVFQDISGEWIISEEMKRFSEIAQTKRIDFIKARLIKRTSLGIWQPIPVTREEADNQKDESSLTKSQLLSVINALTPLLGDLERSRFRDLSSKSRDDLMNTLQDVRNILSESIINTNKEQ